MKIVIALHETIEENNSIPNYSSHSIDSISLILNRPKSEKPIDRRPVDNANEEGEVKGT